MKTREQALKQQGFELKVLGTGAGASYVYDGLPSSSFILLCDEEPFCLVDLGLGVGRKVVESYGSFPDKIVITHNHSDHAADLPVVLRVELANGKKKQVLAHSVVSARLQNHRVAEHHQQMPAHELADWTGLERGEKADIGHGLSIQFYPGIHSEQSFGFLISDSNGKARLSYTGDSCLSRELYQILEQADVFIIDARPKSNPWHASFDEVKPWLQPNRYIIGHGLTEQQASGFEWLPLLLANQTIEF